jgi:hypothetical protein
MCHINPLNVKCWLLLFEKNAAVLSWPGNLESKHRALAKCRDALPSHLNIAAQRKDNK